MMNYRKVSKVSRALTFKISIFWARLHSDYALVLDPALLFDPLAETNKSDSWLNVKCHKYYYKIHIVTKLLINNT